MFFLIKLVIVLLLLGVAFGFFRTWQMEHSDNQKKFENGTVRDVHPDGLYNGSISRKTSWLGKKFNAANSTGINVFEGKGDAYPFVTSYGKGIRDRNLMVINIDYNIAQNPWWMHPILDEIVQVGPDEFLGKLHVRIIPRFPFTLGYFTLKK